MKNSKNKESALSAIDKLANEVFDKIKEDEKISVFMITAKCSDDPNGESVSVSGNTLSRLNTASSLMIFKAFMEDSRTKDHLKNEMLALIVRQKIDSIFKN